MHVPAAVAVADIIKRWHPAGRCMADMLLQTDLTASLSAVVCVIESLVAQDACEYLGTTTAGQNRAAATG
jgi:hypothetical protein